MLTIDPDECIDCAVCIPECPVNAILPEEDVPQRPAALHQAQCRAGQELAEHHQAQARAARRRRMERPQGQAVRADPLSRRTAAARQASTMDRTDPRWPTPPQPRWPDRNRCRHRRRRPGRPVPGVRTRPAGDQGAHHRLAGLRRRAVHRAVPRQADLRHPGRAGVHRQGTDRQPAQADRALRRHLPPRPGGQRRCDKQADGRFCVETSKGTRFLTKTIFIAGGVGSFQPRMLQARRARTSSRTRSCSTACATRRSSPARTSSSSAAATRRSTGR